MKVNPHFAPNEKSLPNQCTKLPIGALVGASSCWPIGTNAHIIITSTSKNCVFNHAFTLLPCIYDDSTLHYIERMLSYLNLNKANCVPLKGRGYQTCYVANALWW
jgi:hypothetical protein